MDANIFTKMAGLFSVAGQRRLAEHEEWLTFHRQVVENVPSEVAKAFGRMDVAACKKDGVGTWGIMLTVADHIFWQDAFRNEGVRFVESPARVRLKMLEHLAKKCEVVGLEPAERKELLAMLDLGQGE